MATLENLIAHLREHPDDHDVRWRVCKKLYLKKEYREGLVHLIRLREDWKPKQNVYRYLAATHYRLGDFDQSVAVLRDAIDRWPNEMPLREQLARVYEVAGDREEAAKVWEIIYRLDPNYSGAWTAIERLQSEDGGDSQPEEGDPVIVCPKCGARNGADFDQCWKCHSILTLNPTPTPIHFESEDDMPVPSTWRLLLSGAVTIMVLAASVYFTLRYVAPQLVFGLEGMSSLGLQEAMFAALAMPRAAAGLAAVIAYPVVLWLCARVIRIKKLAPGQPWLLGLFGGGVIYVAFWAPLPFLPYVLGVAGLICILAGLVTLSYVGARALVLSLVGVSVAGSAAGAAFVIIAGDAPFTNQEAISVLRANALPSRTPSPRRAQTPLTIEHRFSSAGNKWIDEQVGVVVFEVAGNSAASPLQLEYQDAEGRVVASKSMTSARAKIAAHVTPDRVYRLTVSGPPGVDVTVRPACALPIVYSQ